MMFWDGAQSGRLDSEGATETPGGVVGFGAVVIEEDGIETAVAEQGAAEFSDMGRGFDPARGFGVEFAEFLQVAVLVFGEKFDADGGGQIDGAVFGFVFFSGVEGFAVVAEASAVFWAFWGTIREYIFACILITAHNIRFTTGPFHFSY